MIQLPDRRDFLSAGLGGLAFTAAWPRVSNAELQSVAKAVRLDSELEPTVRFIEETQREKLLGEVSRRILAGTSYAELFGALMLAGVRGIKPRPVGFKFHAVLVLNSAHLAAIHAPDRDRWLPLLWAIDNFKASQARNKVEHGDWMMAPVDEARLPASHQARRALIDAMENWDEAGADVAIAALARSAGAAEIFEVLWRYGSRDFHDIAHKAIYVANAWRCLHVVGWRHAEPVLRSLAFALLDGPGVDPAKRDNENLRAFAANQKRVKTLRPEWRSGKRDAAVVHEITGAMRTASSDEVATLVCALLNRGVDPSCIWDGLFLSAAELLMRQPGIGGLHTLTSLNAFRFAFETSGVDETRALMLLQGASFLPLFRQFMARQKMRADIRIDSFSASDPGTVEEILADISKDKDKAAAKTIALAGDPARAAALMHGARRLIFSKGRDAHDYKFSAAIFEDYHHLAPEHRDRFLAGGLYWLKGTGDPDNDLIRRARGMLEG